MAQVGSSMPLSIQCQHASPCLPPAHHEENNCLSALPHPSGPLQPKLILPRPYTHQDQLEATQPKTYCCITALRQNDEGGNECCESYCWKVFCKIRKYQEISAIRLSDHAHLVITQDAFLKKQIQRVETVHQLKDLDSSIEYFIDPVEASQSTDRVNVADCDLWSLCQREQMKRISMSGRQDSPSLVLFQFLPLKLFHVERKCARNF